jgi:hypothetical protein
MSGYSSGGQRREKIQSDYGGDLESRSIKKIVGGCDNLIETILRLMDLGTNPADQEIPESRQLFEQ